MVHFGDRQVGDGHPVFVTFEAGPTHDGLDSAKKLVKLAAECGADAIKFQVLDPDRLCSDRKVEIEYDVLVDRATEKTETVSESLYEIMCRRAMSDDEWTALKSYSDDMGLAFFATIGFEEEVDLMEKLGCHSIKIASADVNHLPLIRRVAKTGMCVQLDTGNSTIGEVENAVEAILEEDNENIIIHQCPSGYPARLPSINLNIIKTLKQMFPFPIAYSDHSPGWDMDIAAVALGANLIEKTLTFDRTTRGPEYMFSLEPPDVKKFIHVMRDLEIAMGLPRRVMKPAELDRRRMMRRSVFLVEGGKKGDRLSDLKVDFRRPGFALAPDTFERLSDARLQRDLPPGHRLELSDLFSD